MKRVTLFAASSMPVDRPGTKKNRTARMLIPVNVSGSTLLLRFSNRYGTKPAVMDHVTIAKCTESGCLMPETVTDVLFRAHKVGRIDAGEDVVSDAVDLPVLPGDYLAVSVYCRGRAATACGLSGFSVAAKAPGDLCSQDIHANAKKEASYESMIGQPPVVKVPCLRAVDVLTNASPKVLSAMGDSITQHCRWFAPLQKSLYAQYPGEVILLNHGICGNQYTGEITFPRMFGEAGCRRLQWDVLGDFGVSHVLFAMGVNDIGTGHVRADEFIPAVEEFLRTTKEQKLDTALFTIFPAKIGRKDGVPEEELRLSYCEQMRRLPDTYVIDLENILKHPDHIGYRDGYGTKDHLHLNACGGAVMAAAIEQDMIRFLGIRHGAPSMERDASPDFL